jgi:hypothetical protein
LQPSSPSHTTTTLCTVPAKHLPKEEKWKRLKDNDDFKWPPMSKKKTSPISRFLYSHKFRTTVKLKVNNLTDFFLRHYAKKSFGKEA